MILIAKLFFEDKNASGLYMSNPTVPQTELQWAKNKFITKRLIELIPFKMHPQQDQQQMEAKMFRQSAIFRALITMYLE